MAARRRVASVPFGNRSPIDFPIDFQIDDPGRMVRRAPEAIGAAVADPRKQSNVPRAIIARLTTCISENVS
jgi:hypothetical protein